MMLRSHNARGRGSRRERPASAAPASTNELADFSLVEAPVIEVDEEKPLTCVSAPPPIGSGDGPLEFELPSNASASGAHAVPSMDDLMRVLPAGRRDLFSGEEIDEIVANMANKTWGGGDEEKK